MDNFTVLESHKLPTAKCGDGTDHTVFIDTNILDANEGIIMDLQGGGECNNIDECKGRCPEGTNNGLCTATKNPSMMREGGFYSREDENPFKNFVKVYQPYCTSDIHQGANGPSDATGGFHFDGVNSVMETLELLNQKFDFSKIKSFVLKGCSAGGKGVAGNCDRVGDYIMSKNPEINYKCVADAAGWLPLPLKNTENCNNNEREHESTKLWNREINSDCSADALEHNRDPVADCSFETQYAKWHKHPIMFVGSLQDTTFFERHTCEAYGKAPAWEVSLWINHLHQVTTKYIRQNPEIGIWLTPCPGHCTSERGKDGFNQEKIDGYRPIDAIEKFVFENIPVHVLPSITHSYEQCPNGYCNGIGRETACGTPQTSEAECVSYGCAWCPEPGKQQKCIHVVLG